jgi:hypothetical protein
MRRINRLQGMITLSSTRNISTGNQEHEELEQGADHEEDQQVAGDDHPLLHQEHQYR